MTPNKFIREARATLGITQMELAHRLGIHRRSVIRYEADGYHVPPSVGLAVERLLGPKLARQLQRKLQ